MAEPGAREKSELTDELRRTREQLTRSTASLQQALDVPARIKANMQRNRMIWMGSAATIAGLLLLRAATKKKRTQAVEFPSAPAVRSSAAVGVALAAGKLLWNTFRPKILSLATKQVVNIVSRFGVNPSSPTNPTSVPSQSFPQSSPSDPNP